MSLDSALFWLVALALVDNTHWDFFDRVDDLCKDHDQGQVLTNGYEADGHMKGFDLVSVIGCKDSANTIILSFM